MNLIQMDNVGREKSKKHFIKGMVYHTSQFNLI